MSHFHQEMQWNCESIDARLKALEKKYADLVVENQRFLDGFLASKVVDMNKQLEKALMEIKERCIDAQRNYRKFIRDNESAQTDFNGFCEGIRWICRRVLPDFGMDVEP